MTDRTHDKRILDPKKEREWLELPGRSDHEQFCPCRLCNQHRQNWAVAIERTARGGVMVGDKLVVVDWPRERVLAHGEHERRAVRDAADRGRASSDRGDQGEARPVQQGGGAAGGAKSPVRPNPFKQ